MSGANQSASPPPAWEADLAHLRWDIDSAVMRAASEAAAKAGHRVMDTAGIHPGTIPVSWTYDRGRLDGAVLQGTPRAEIERLCRTIAGLLGGQMATVPGGTVIIEAQAYAPAPLTAPAYRLHIRVWGAVPGESE